MTSDMVREDGAEVVGYVPGTDIPIVEMRVRVWTGVEVVLGMEAEGAGWLVEEGLTAGERVVAFVDWVVERRGGWRVGTEGVGEGWTWVGVHLLVPQGEAEFMLGSREAKEVRGRLGRVLEEYEWLLLGVRLAGEGESWVRRQAVDVETVRVAEAAMGEVLETEWETVMVPMVGTVR